MKILHKLCYIALVSVLTLPHLLLAATSQRISYQGRLANPQGKLLDGEFCMQFSIWDDPNPGSGTQLWPVGGEKDTYDGGAGNQTQITVTEGVFNVELGTDISLDSTNWEAGTYWDSNGETTYLHVEIAQYRAGCQTYETLAPRQSITASGQTQNADKLDGMSTGQSGTNYIPFADSNGRVGIGIEDPNTLLHLSSDTSDTTLTWSNTTAIVRTAGPNNPSSAVDAGGARIWGNKNYIFSSDNNRAQAACDDYCGTGTTSPLSVTGFNFNIPTDATIKGIQVEVERNSDELTDRPQDHEIKIIKGGVVGTENKATDDYWPDIDENIYQSYGGSDDFWSESWTPTDINTANFGVYIIARADIRDPYALWQIDHVRITVYYALPGNTHWQMGVDSSDNGKFKIAYNSSDFTSSLMTFTSEENVGIGTTNPYADLQVEGEQIVLSNSAMNASLSLRIGDAWPSINGYSEETQWILGVSEDYGPDDGVVFGTFTDDPVRIAVNNQEVVRATSAGLGIGIDPISTLDVYGAGQRVLLAEAGLLRVALGDVDDNYNGLKLVVDDDAGYSYFSHGNVGIGITAPDYLFEVYDNTDSITAVFRNANDYGIYFGNGYMLGDEEYGIYNYGSDVPLAVFDYNTDTTRYGYNGNLVVLNGYGYVGIGTTQPSANLHIIGDNAIDGDAPDVLYVKGGTGGGRNTKGGDIILEAGEAWDDPYNEYNGNGGDVRIYGGDGYYANFDSGSGGDIILEPGDPGEDRETSGDVILAASNYRGYVGIGTTNPLRKLHIYDTSNTSNTSARIENTGAGSNAKVEIATNNSTGGDPSLFFEITEVGTWYQGVDNSNNDSMIWGRGGDIGINSLMSLTTSGNVGIGITSPTAYLHLKAGTASTSTSPLKFTSGTLNATPEVGAVEYDGSDLYFTDSGTTRYKICDASGNCGPLGIPSGTEGQMLYNNEGTWTAFSGMYWDDTYGYLGIGTTTPDSELYVNGLVSVVGDIALIGGEDRLISVTTASFGESPSNLTLKAGTGATLMGGMNGADLYLEGGNGAGSPGDGGNVYINGGNSSGMSLNQGDVILAYQGMMANVGIGTTAPNTKLEVNGGIRLNTAEAKPICDATQRGTMWSTQSAAGVKDTFELCAKDAADTYAWRTIY